MVLIIGGAYQGKKKYAQEKFSGMEIVVDFHKMILELVKNNENPIEWININLDKFKDKVILCDDIFCGVVPMDKNQRKWREELGKVLSIVSENSDTVVRMFCSIPSILK